MVIRVEIWLVSLDPTVGSEIQKSRPYVVISPPELHDHLRTVIIARMSTVCRAAPFRIPVSHIGKKGLILLDQIRAVDKIRLVIKFDAVSKTTLAATLGTLEEVFSV